MCFRCRNGWKVPSFGHGRVLGHRVCLPLVFNLICFRSLHCSATFSIVIELFIYWNCFYCDSIQILVLIFRFSRNSDVFQISRNFFHCKWATFGACSVPPPTAISRTSLNDINKKLFCFFICWIHCAQYLAYAYRCRIAN